MKTKEPIFYDSQGFLTSYGFSCGYIESRETDFISLQMYKEHNTFHVIYINNTDNGRIWESFDTFGEAKIYFFKMCTKLNFKLIKQQISLI